MKYIYIGREIIHSMDDLHDEFARVLNFPDYYGRNLDALYDMLSEQSEEILVIVNDREELTERLGSKFDAFLKMLHEDEEEPSNLLVRVV